MCGFVGISHAKSEFHRAALERSADDIAKRGTTCDKLYLDQISLAYSRLPTDAVDSWEDNKIHYNKEDTILFNGIITNVDYLCDTFSLSEKARQLDTFCLREGYSLHGKAFLQKVRGMFAFAYISGSSITIVRDTVGIKPLYYQLEKGLFTFASEIKCLYKAAPDRKIKELFPGEILTVDTVSGSVHHDKFHYRPYKYFKQADIHDCLREAIVSPSLRYLQQTNRDIGILLSGGLDSSLLCYLLFTNLPNELLQRIKVFTLGDEDSEDVHYAKIVQRQLGIDVTYLSPWSGQKTFENFEDVIYSVESADPRVVKVALLQGVLSQALEAQDIQVLISGEGADELFFGYDRFYENLPLAQVEQFFSTFRKEVFPQTLLQRYERQFARRCIEGRVPFLDQEFIALSKLFTTSEKLISTSKGIFNKAPLRKLATNIGLEASVSGRAKMKMTKGVTNEDNSENQSKGYLEDLFITKTSMSFREYCLLTMNKLFPNYAKTFPVPRYTEEELMDQVAVVSKMSSRERIAS